MLKLCEDNRTFTISDFNNSVLEILESVGLKGQLKEAAREGLMIVMASACLISNNETELLEEMHEFMTYIQGNNK